MEDLSGAQALLARVLGDWIYGGETVSLFSSFASLMAAGGLILFVVLVHWIIVGGLFKTASDGDFLGKDWSTLWVPLRLLLSLLFVIPLTNTSGFSLGQLGLATVGDWSTQGADWTWRQTLSLASGSRILTDPDLQAEITPIQAREFVENTWVAVACLDARITYDNPLQHAGAGDAAFAALVEDHRQSCGIPTYAVTPPIERNIEAGYETWPGRTAAKAWLRDDWIAHQRVNLDNAINTVNYQWYRHLLELYQANKAQLNEQGELPLNMVEVAGQYRSDVNAALHEALTREHVEASRRYIEEAAKYGWVSAANYYKDLSQQQQVIQSAISDSVARRSPDPRQQIRLTEADDMVNFQIDVAAKESEGFFDRMISTIGGGWDAVTGPVKTYLADYADFAGMRFLAAGEETDPILSMSRFGQHMVPVGLLLMGTGQIGTIAGAATGFALASPTGPGALAGALLGGFAGSKLGSGATWIGWALVIIGLILGSVLPSVPLLFMILSVVRWQLYLLESIIAAPFWLAAHAAPEGRDHTSNLAAKGYNNLLFIAVYPVLVLGGLIVAITVAWVGMYLLNTSTAALYGNIAGDSTEFALPGQSAFGVVGVVLFYLLGALAIIWRCFTLMETLPITILTWISVGEPGQSPFAGAGDRMQSTIMGWVHRASHHRGSPRAPGGRDSGRIPNSIKNNG